MKDTSSRMERKFRKMLMERSGEQRLKMGCSMHAASRALVKASVLQTVPKASPDVVKQRLFLHFYGNDFKPKQRKRILMALQQTGRDGSGEDGRIGGQGPFLGTKKVKKKRDTV